MEDLDPEVLYELCRRCHGYGSVTLTDGRRILVIKPCARCEGHGLTVHGCDTPRLP
jgi:DnaJ-class molecular chaperone